MGSRELRTIEGIEFCLYRSSSSTAVDIGAGWLRHLRSLPHESPLRYSFWSRNQTCRVIAVVWRARTAAFWADRTGWGETGCESTSSASANHGTIKLKAPRRESGTGAALPMQLSLCVRSMGYLPSAPSAYGHTTCSFGIHPPFGAGERKSLGREPLEGWRPVKRLYSGRRQRGHESSVGDRAEQRYRAPDRVQEELVSGAAS